MIEVVEKYGMNRIIKTAYGVVGAIVSRIAIFLVGNASRESSIILKNSIKEDLEHRESNNV